MDDNRAMSLPDSKFEPPPGGRRRSSPSRKAGTWPKEVRCGSVTIKIYQIIRRGEPLYCVTHYLDNRRNRKNFANPEEAETEAQRIASTIANREQEVLEIGRDDWRLYTLAVSALKETGVP